MFYIKKLVMHGFKSFPKKTEIPFTEGINVILGPNGSGKSCSYDTLVTLSTGEEIELGKLIENQIKKSSEIKKLDDGIYVDGKEETKILSLNKESMKIEEKTISKFIRRTGDPLYKLTTAMGKEVKATGCHPVMVFKSGEVNSVLIKDLKEGDLIASPRMIEVNNKKNFNKDIARLIGYIIGDGYVAKDRIEFINKDPEIIEDFKKIINDYFGVKIVERNEKNAMRMYIRDKHFVQYVRSIFSKESENSITSKDKKIPNSILISGNITVSNLLAGLYDTDGSVRKDLAVIEFCTKNKSLAHQVQGLLLRFGVISKIKLRSCCASNTKNKIKRDYFYIYISGKNNIKNFYENIHLKIDYKKQTLLNHLSKEIIPNTNVDLLPKETNFYIKELAMLLGLKIKPLRKQYPCLLAYIENRCLPTREGVSKILKLFREKLLKLNDLFKNMSVNQINLVKFMDELNIPGNQASMQVGINQVIIRRDWATSRFNARQENLEKFYSLLKYSFTQRISRISRLMIILNNLSTSDIFWDKISSITKLKKEKYVYDLTIENNHNFIANNIFVHNSNVSDALCFVLGRLSIKSMRATKAGNLIFLGSKIAAPSKEASVEIVFDNSDDVLSLKEKEVSIKRIVRRNGQSIYKINGETQTRQEILSLLAQAGIDPNGFNIILQGEIQNFVNLHSEERRKVIEEVSGIAIYESRKEKSLKELDRTEEKLKEVLAILRERTSYLNNLEKERQQALRYKKLEKDVQSFKASIIFSDLNKNKKEIERVELEISKKSKEIEKLRGIISGLRFSVETSENKISSINSTIQKSTGVEQEKLNQEIANIRAELAGTTVKIENYESKIASLSKEKQELQELIRNNETSLLSLKKEEGTSIKGRQQKDLDLKKQELEKLEEARKNFYMVKSELKSLKNRIEDKKTLFQTYSNESTFLLNQIKSISRELFDKNTDQNKIEKLKLSLAEKKIILEDLNKKEKELEKSSSTKEYEIDKQDKIVQNIGKMDICPLCKSKITEEHIKDIGKEVKLKVDSLKKQIEEADKDLSEVYKKREMLVREMEEISLELSKRESDLIKLSNVDEKKNQIKNLYEKTEILTRELEELDKIKDKLEKTFNSNLNVEQKYETARVEVQEISIRSDETITSEISFKQREIERAKISLKQFSREEEDLTEDLKQLKKEFDEDESLLENKRKQEEALSKKFEALIAERDSFQKKIRETEVDIANKQNELHNVEQSINDIKIEKARFNAIVENLEIEMLGFQNIEIIKTNKESLLERLEKAQGILSQIGTVNLRSLEVYDSVKKEYDLINEKVEIITKEKNGVLKIIHEVDVKKKKTFLSTLDALNDIFLRNFSQLSTKGQVTLEIENRKDPFDGGIGIIVKTGHGKYFDVKSLSGGEQTLVALSLIFAIQELKPYYFYILDEIDAALDKRNSERLAGLLTKYMQKGQYIVISHNDEVITRATTLYGVSMHDGISKIVSLKV
jgi:chromosome segregation protein